MAKKKSNKKKPEKDNGVWMMVFIAICFAIVYGWIKPTFFD
jgi:hypothetical protein